VKHREVLQEPRQLGMMMGLKMSTEMCGPLLTLAGMEHGIFTVWANNDNSVSQIIPPLIVTYDEALEILERLDVMLTWVEEHLE